MRSVNSERILVVDDDESMRDMLSIMLRKEGYDVAATESGREALRLLSEAEYDCIITDIRMRGVDGHELLREIKRLDPESCVMMMTAYSSVESVVEALRDGAADYFVKSRTTTEEIKLRLRKVLESERLRRENIRLRTELRRQAKATELVGESPAFRRLLEVIDRVAAAESTVVITGESGTGKELVAREIHLRSPRAEGPFVTISCGALPENLLESELFGHLKGSFTGAHKDKQGLFQVANGGSLFLDEVGETSAAIQVKLLRALQEREVVPVGGTRPVPIDVRLLAATNSDLEQAVSKGTFRPDLYYRLNVIPVRVPPLRERGGDITRLVDYFIRQYCQAYDLPLKKIDGDALEALQAYDWPGNVRELQNTIERAVVLHDGTSIALVDLPERVQRPLSVAAGRGDPGADRTLREMEREEIRRLLAETGGDKSKVADVLGVHLSTLYRKIKAHGIDDV